VSDVVLGDRESHGDDGAFAGAVGEAFAESVGAGDGRNIKDDAAALGFHLTSTSVNAVVIALDVDAHDAVKVGLGGGFDIADVRDAGVVDEDVDAVFLENFVEGLLDGGLVGDVASERRRAAPGLLDFGGDFFGSGEVEIEDEDGGSSGSEAESNGAANAAACTGDRGNFAFESEWRFH